MNDVLSKKGPNPAPTPNAIQLLNDRFRTKGIGNGTMMVTLGVHALGDDFIKDAFQAVKTFDDFTPENDPWQEHDGASLVVRGKKLIWKIDYFNLDKTARSVNPADESKTHRVLIIMLANEY